ncbi:MAG: hypothetical protein C4287_02380 [Leptolyngbya sp. ERB_1_2]
MIRSRTDGVIYTALYAERIYYLMDLMTMLNIIAVVSYFVVLTVSIWAVSEYELELARVRKALILS